MRTRPDLVRQMQQRLQASGLTPEQVRARLRAAGYPESMLDSYLSGGSGPADGDTTSTASVLDAVRALGITDSTDVDLLGGLADTTESGRLDTAGANRRFRRDSAAAAAQRDSGFTIFGRDLFENRTSQFEPNLAGPVDPNYRLGPGDRLVLILTGDVELAHTLDVTREGFVVIPQVGQLYVNNLSLAQLEDLLYSRLGRVYSGVQRGAGARTRFSVSVARLRSNQVFVVGDVTRPGSYRVSSAGTALSALYAAGGPTETGSLRRILVRRGGRVVDSLDVYDYLLQGDASHDARLETGDVVFVPPHLDRVRLVGAVLRPATYELKRGETLTDLIRTAGGLTPTASQRRIQIERVLAAADRGTSGRDRVVIDLTIANAGRPLPTQALSAGDVVRVFEVTERVRDRVLVTGNVWAPGPQGIRPGMRISDALRLAGGVKPDVYLGEIQITRLRSDSTRVQLRAALRDTTGAVVNDFALQEDDEIRVFSATEFRPARSVAITGAVRRPGRFPYREGMTMRDLALLAGGLDESALLSEAEIARLPEDRRNGVTARTFRVPLDSSYLFERGPDGRYAGPPGLPAPAGNAPDVVLSAYDNVLILRQPDFALQRTVFLGGEVRYPGRYALRTKTDRLSDLLARAGGLTSEGYADGVEFYRPRGRVGRIGIDLPTVLRNRAFRDNLVLSDGDSVIVPPYNGVVSVTGAVNAPVSVAYVPGRNIDFYVNAAGGPNRTADARHAYVIQPNGKLEASEPHHFAPDKKPRPRPGARVVVPERAPNDQRDLSQVLTLTGQIVGTLTALLAAIIAIKRQ